MKQILWATLVVALITSCKDKEEETEKTYGSIKVKFEHFWGHTHTNYNAPKFALNKDWIHEASEDTLNFSALKYYISNVTFTSVTGTLVAEKESYHLIDVNAANPFEISIKDLPADEYVSIAFIIGVDSTRNVSGAQEGALSPSNEMFWTWNTGYRFIVAEGACVKSTGNQDLVYHLGGFSGANNAINILSFPFGETVTASPSATPSVHLEVNVQALWTSTFKASENLKIHMPGSKAVSAADNFAEGFELDHVHR